MAFSSQIYMNRELIASNVKSLGLNSVTLPGVPFGVLLYDMI